MRQLYFIEAGKLEWREEAAPGLERPDQALVRPVAVARCDLDFAIVTGKAPFVGPFPLGHEFVAEIVELGDEVTGFHKGQHVVVPFQISCGHCARCHRELTGSCTTVPYRSMYGLGALGGEWGGAFCDLVRVPFAQNMLVALPAGIEPVAAASVSDNIADAWRTVGPYLEQSPDQSVLVVGGGAWSIGLYSVAIARALGAASVDYVDSDAPRLEIAAALGANAIVGPPKRRMGEYDITVDASSQPEGLACALRSTAPGGISTSVGIYFNDKTPIPLFEMYDKGVTFVTGRANARVAIPKILALMESGRLQPERVTTKVARWHEAAEALVDPSAKVVVVR